MIGILEDEDDDEHEDDSSNSEFRLKGLYYLEEFRSCRSSGVAEWDNSQFSILRSFRLPY